MFMFSALVTIEKLKRILYHNYMVNICSLICLFSLEKAKQEI